MGQPILVGYDPRTKDRAPVRPGVVLARLARAGSELFYLVDNAALDGLWVHEGEVETCRVARSGT